jgi:hypothetical protein
MSTCLLVDPPSNHREGKVNCQSFHSPAFRSAIPKCFFWPWLDNIIHFRIAHAIITINTLASAAAKISGWLDSRPSSRHAIHLLPPANFQENSEVFLYVEPLYPKNRYDPNG